MRTISLLCFAFFTFSAAAQSISLIGGVNHNRFFDLEYDGGHSSSSYDSGQGISMQLAMDDIALEWLPLRFTLGYDSYAGDLVVRSGGQGGSYTTEATVNKSILSLGVYPLNLKFWNSLRLNVGFEFGWLLNEYFEGEQYGWVMNSDRYRYTIQDKYAQFSASKNYGIKSRIAYDIPLSESWFLSPQYAFYYGLSAEFEQFPTGTRSMRHSILIGISKHFGELIIFEPKEE